MRSKWKKVLWTVLSALLVVVVAAGYRVYVLLFTSYGNWELNHGFKTPKPDQVVTLFYDYGPTGDGESYEYATYNIASFAEMKSMNKWQTVTSDDQIAYLQKQIELCRQFMKTDVHPADPFQQRPVQITKGTKFFLKTKPDNFFIVLVRENKNQIDVIENES